MKLRDLNVVSEENFNRTNNKNQPSKHYKWLLLLLFSVYFSLSLLPSPISLSSAVTTNHVIEFFHYVARFFLILVDIFALLSKYCIKLIQRSSRILLRRPCFCLYFAKRKHRLRRPHLYFSLFLSVSTQKINCTNTPHNVNRSF